MVRSITQCSNSISLISATKENISLPSGSTPYTQVIFDFDIPEGKKIIAVTSIQTNRPAACAIASFNSLENNKLEVWYKNVLGESTSITVSVTVLAMQHSISHQTYVIDKTSIEANGAYNLTNREWPVPFVDLWGVWAQVTNARVQVEIRNATNTGFDVGIRNVTNANASFDNEKISIHGLGLIQFSISLTKEIELASGVVLFVLGKIGIIRFGISLSNISWNWKTVATVDELYKPISTFTSCLKGEQAANVNGAFYAANARIQTDGTVSVNPGNYANESISGELVYIIAQFSISLEPTTHVGSKVVSVYTGTNYVNLWSANEFLEEFGRCFDSTKDYIGVMNGDSSMQTKAVAECGFTNNNKDVGSYISGQVNGQMRVNYVLFLGKQFSISPVSVECDLNANALGQKIKLNKVGKLVTMSIGGTQLSSNLAAWGSRQIATIPVGFRPKDENIYAALCTDNGVAAIKVNEGVLNVESRRDALTAKLDLFAGASWVTDQYFISQFEELDIDSGSVSPGTWLTIDAPIKEGYTAISATFVGTITSGGWQWIINNPICFPEFGLAKIRVVNNNNANVAILGKIIVTYLKSKLNNDSQ